MINGFVQAFETAAKECKLAELSKGAMDKVVFGKPDLPIVKECKLSDVSQSSIDKIPPQSDLPIVKDLSGSAADIDKSSMGEGSAKEVSSEKSDGNPENDFATSAEENPESKESDTETNENKDNEEKQDESLKESEENKPESIENDAENENDNPEVDPENDVSDNEENKQKDTDETAEKKGGRFGDVFKEGEGETKEVHHIPADSTTELSRNDGPAIKMDKADHKQTASCGNSKEAQEYRQKQKELIEQGKFREAVQMDIDDIHEKFGDKYDDAISEMLEYVDQLEKEGKI